MDVERDEVVRRLGEEGFVVLDVRSDGEYTGDTVAPCDPRPGESRGAALRPAGAAALTQDEIQERLGPPEDVELVAYCHSGSRSELAAEILALARLPRLELPRLVARVVAGRVAARPRPARPLRGRREQSRAAELVPAVDPLARRGHAAPQDRGRRRGPRASHASTCPARTSGWNWTPHASPEPERLRADRGCGPARPPPSGRSWV